MGFAMSALSRVATIPSALYSDGISRGPGDTVLYWIIDSSVEWEDTFDVHPVLPSSGEGLQHDKILGGAGTKDKAWGILEMGGSLDGQLLERQAAQSHVQTDAVTGSDQEHPVVEGKAMGVGDSSLEVFQ
jgi:hypothetical protein